MEDSSVYRSGNLLYTQENLSSYRPGGYHPVRLCDTFKNGRYKIHHKLGWGGFSTVWLAKDRENTQWVSLKILTADSSRGSRELRNLRHLEKHSERSLSSNYIAQLFDSFTHQGPNGLHQCLVFELLGPSVDKVLADYYHSGDTLETENILRMTEQLLEAIQFIHDAGMGHGDISGRNIAFSCGNLSNAAEEDLFEVLGLPETEKLVRRDGRPLDDGLPKHMVKAVEWDEWVDEDEEDLRILDLGEGFLQGHEPKSLSQPGQLQVPETIIGNPFDHRVDLWRAGSMIYSFIFRRTPFWYLDDDGALVEQMVGFVEKLPVDWQPAWDRMRSNSKHQLEPMEDRQLSELERRFNKRVHDPTLARLVPVIRGLMRFLPSSRMKASAALDLLRQECLTESESDSSDTVS